MLWSIHIHLLFVFKTLISCSLYFYWFFRQRVTEREREASKACVLTRNWPVAFGCVGRCSTNWITLARKVVFVLFCFFLAPVLAFVVALALNYHPPAVDRAGSFLFSRSWFKMSLPQTDLSWLCFLRLGYTTLSIQHSEIITNVLCLFTFVLSLHLRSLGFQRATTFIFSLLYALLLPAPRTAFGMQLSVCP